ncbi:MAG TPA: CoA transferase [Bacillales bacterium]|nr:CoA transferase [Bacillales bacterium]
MIDELRKQSPLEGVRVVELGNFIAAPFMGRLLADYGAEVIKVEMPEQGDSIRKWGNKVEKNKSIWWSTQSRNKKCVTLNLKTARGQEIARQLCKTANIVVENFRPGTLEKWKLGYEDLKKIHPKLIMVRISGFGQDGPYSNRAGFGSVGEAMGGIRYVTGYPDLPPPRVGISIGDSVAAMFGALGAMVALYHQKQHNDEQGQLIDVALYESVFALMENAIGEYYKYGIIKERTGTILPKVAPSNAYMTKDQKWVIIAANADNIFNRLTEAIGHPEWKDDSRFCTHEARGEHQQELDDLIAQWTASKPLSEVMEIMDSHAIPSGPIYSIADIAKDPHYHYRDMIQKIEDEDLGEVHMPGIVPKLSRTPGNLNWAGPRLGAHNKEIYEGLLDFSEQELEQLKREGVI